MKDLKWLSVEDYANSPQELTVISCMKGYLRRMEPEDALRRLSEIIKPKVVSLNEGAGKIYITTFLDFKTYKKFSEALAWETEVWIAEMPEHMIHLNGNKFLGPRED